MAKRGSRKQQGLTPEDFKKLSKKAQAQVKEQGGHKAFKDAAKITDPSTVKAVKDLSRAVVKQNTSNENVAKKVADNTRKVQSVTTSLKNTNKLLTASITIQKQTLKEIQALNKAAKVTPDTETKISGQKVAGTNLLGKLLADKPKADDKDSQSNQGILGGLLAGYGLKKIIGARGAASGAGAAGAAAGTAVAKGSFASRAGRFAASRLGRFSILGGLAGGLYDAYDEYKNTKSLKRAGLIGGSTALGTVIGGATLGPLGAIGGAYAGQFLGRHAATLFGVGLDSAGRKNEDSERIKELKRQQEAAGATSLVKKDGVFVSPNPNVLPGQISTNPQSGGSYGGSGGPGVPPGGRYDGRASGPAPGSAAAYKTAMTTAMDQLRKEGVPEANLKAAAAHLVGQAAMESSLNPTLSHDSGTGYGIYGARLDRRTRMFQWLDKNNYARDSLEGQMRYMAHEAMTDRSYAQTRNILMNASAETMARDTPIITKNFENPAVVNYRTHAVERAHRMGALEGADVPGMIRPDGQGPVALGPIAEAAMKSNILKANGRSGDAAHIDQLRPEVKSRLIELGKVYKEQTGRALPINSANRSFQEQADLYANRGSNRNPVARPGHSKHEGGKAFDIPAHIARQLEADGTLDRLGLWRPFGERDPVHIEVKPGASAVSASDIAPKAPTENPAPKIKPSTIAKSGGVPQQMPIPNMMAFGAMNPSNIMGMIFGMIANAAQNEIPTSNPISKSDKPQFAGAPLPPRRPEAPLPPERPSEPPPPARPAELLKPKNANDHPDREKSKLEHEGTGMMPTTKGDVEQSKLKEHPMQPSWLEKLKKAVEPYHGTGVPMGLI